MKLNLTATKRTGHQFRIFICHYILLILKLIAHIDSLFQSTITIIHFNFIYQFLLFFISELSMKFHFSIHMKHNFFYYCLQLFFCQLVYVHLYICHKALSSIIRPLCSSTPVRVSGASSNLLPLNFFLKPSRCFAKRGHLVVQLTGNRIRL